MSESGSLVIKSNRVATGCPNQIKERRVGREKVKHCKDFLRGSESKKGRDLVKV